ncbi:MAG: hemerythrin family protein [Aquabacterium sp.]|uniref:hemerythrin family protein n=1 Tax=Aquabacterium sp. TaxID=1872578 RepID=UPI00271E20CB|nr:hemerythrin family protein [Aquabacterium sp.]MDO9005004.1 hemerythrin family protein [Aquabacterium sp.]
MSHTVDPARLFDHSAFAELLNALLDLLDNEAPEGEIDAQLQSLQQHLQQQFAAEEQAMQTANFPGADGHKTHHDRALNKLAQRIAQWQQRHDRKVLLDYLENELAEWFVSHVNMRDFITAKHLSLPRQADT